MLGWFALCGRGEGAAMDTSTPEKGFAGSMTFAFGRCVRADKGGSGAADPDHGASRLGVLTNEFARPVRRTGSEENGESDEGLLDILDVLIEERRSPEAPAGASGARNGESLLGKFALKPSAFGGGGASPPPDKLMLVFPPGG